MIRSRRLVRDYEKRLDMSEAMIHVAMGTLLLRRIAHRRFSNGLSLTVRKVADVWCRALIRRDGA